MIIILKSTIYSKSTITDNGRTVCIRVWDCIILFKSNINAYLMWLYCHIANEYTKLYERCYC